MQVVFNCDSVERLRMLLEMAPIEDATILWLTKHGQDDMAKKALEIVRGSKYPIQVR